MQVCIYKFRIHETRSIVNGACQGNGWSIHVCKVANLQVSQYSTSHSPLDDSQAVIVEEGLMSTLHHCANNHDIQALPCSSDHELLHCNVIYRTAMASHLVHNRVGYLLLQ